MISILDLTISQIEAVERHVGLPFQRWSEASQVGLSTAILSAVEGQPIESYQDLTLSQLLERVDVESADPEA